MVKNKRVKICAKIACKRIAKGGIMCELHSTERGVRRVRKKRM